MGRSLLLEIVHEREALEGLLEDLVRLCAEYDEPPVEKKRRNRIDPDRIRPRSRPCHRLGVKVAADRGLGIDETELGGERPQDVRFADVQSFLPVRLHETVVGGRVEPLRAGQLREAKRRPRVRYDLRRRVVDEVVPLERALQVAVEPFPVTAEQVGAGNATRRVLGMQVEGQPLDGGAEPARKPLGRSLADTAERSDVVRPDHELV